MTPTQIRWREFDKRETLRELLRPATPPPLELVAQIRAALIAQHWVFPPRRGFRRR